MTQLRGIKIISQGLGKKSVGTPKFRALVESLARGIGKLCGNTSPVGILFPSAP